MAKQLIFASVSEGLQPGRTGYCLVEGHIDLPTQLISLLERETSVPYNPEEPITWIIKSLEVSGKTWKVIGRQITAIPDYSGRQSCLTHLLLEEESKLPEEFYPEPFAYKFSDWQTTIPKSPKSFTDDDIIVLGTPPASIKTTQEGFKLEYNDVRPTPQPAPTIQFKNSTPKKSFPFFLVGISIVVIGVIIYFLK